MHTQTSSLDNVGCTDRKFAGWTSGDWASNAPWTSWTGCVASTTASSVYTTTVSTSGSAIVSTATGYGLALAQATDASASGASASSSESGNAAPAVTGFFAGSAAGAAGILGAALLL